MNEITPEQIAEWRALEQAATPGPWQEYGSEWGDDGQMLAGYVATRNSISGYPDSDITGDGLPASDAAFIAAARTAVPALLAEVERLAGERLNHNDLLRAIEALEAERNMALDMHQVQYERANRLEAERGARTEALAHMTRIALERKANLAASMEAHAGAGEVARLREGIEALVENLTAREAHLVALASMERGTEHARMAGKATGLRIGANSARALLGPSDGSGQ